MISRTATSVLLLLALWSLWGILGCTGASSPAAPGASEVVASSDTGEGTRTAADGTFSGVLTDSNGDPLAWAEIYIDGEIAGWTGEDGSFTIYGVDEEVETALEARIDGEVVYKTTVVLAARNAQEFGDPDPEIDRGTVWGFVHDQLGPVKKAFVVVFNQTENFGADFTDENGYYNVPDAPAGPGLVLAFAPEHATAKDQVFVIAEGEVQKNLFLPAKLDFGIVGGFVVTGPMQAPKPIPHALVELEPIGVPGAKKIETFTNKHGVYLFPPIPLGPHQLWAKAPCFNVGHRLWDVHPGQNMINFHLEPANCGGVEGKVSDPEGKPVPEAIVRLIHPNPDDPDAPPLVMWEVTSPKGLYRFDPVKPGKYQLECMKDKFQPYVHQGPVVVFPDQFTVIDIVLQPVDE